MPMTQIERRFFSITDPKITQTDAEPGQGNPQRLEGYAAVFDSPSENFGDFYEVIRPGAFTRSLADVANGTRKVHALWSHMESQPLGSTGTGKLQLREDAKGLWFSLDVTRFTPAQLDAVSDGDCRMSFGFSIRDKRWSDQADGTTIREILDADLVEVSPVINPAYPDTSAALRSMQEWRSLSQALEPKDSTPEPIAEASDEPEQPTINFSLKAKKLDALERLLRL